MRPQFHFTAERGWINDPHGITVHDGSYHTFYQYVPDSTEWAPSCHWGHASGPDLFSLTPLPVAIAPGDGDDGIWTGSLVTAEDGATRIFYTATNTPDFGIGRIRVATPSDRDWVQWHKGAVVVEAPPGLDLIAYRDPFIKRDPDGWRMFVGAATAEGRAMALTYRSGDLQEWAYEGVALERSTTERDPVWLGALWECPQIIEVDGVHSMVSSVWDADVLHYAGYALGSYSSGTFDAKTWGQLTYGPSYYAPSFFRDADGRPCLLFWMRGVSDPQAGWASAHSVPHVLRVQDDRLIATPHPDLERYRLDPVEDGHVPGLAADVIWRPTGSGVLQVTSGEVPLLDIRTNLGALLVWAGEEEYEMPFDGGDVRVILDAQAIEISCTAGVLGLVSEPAGRTLTVRGEHVTVHPLTR